MLKFKIFEKFDEECSKTFELLIQNANYNFFQTYNYLKNLSSENKGKIKIVAVYDNKKIIAILPLEIKKYFIFKILQWIGTERSDVCNPILIKNFNFLIKDKEFTNLWKNILKHLGDYDLIFFNNQLSQIGSCTNPFTEYLKSTKFSKIYQILLPENFKNYLDNQKIKDKKRYYELHRTTIKSNKLEQNLNVSFSMIKLPNENINFADIIRVKKKQLENKNIKHNLDNKFIQTFDNLIKKKDIKYFFAKLKIENKAISSCFGIFLNDTFYYYIPFLESNDYNNYKPGKILILKIISWCIDNKIKVFDFGLGEEKYKENFSNRSLSLHRYVKHNSVLGRFLLIVMKIVFFRKKF